MSPSVAWSVSTGKSGKEFQTYWPINNGALGQVKKETLKPGTIVDRYGNEGGSYVSLVGTPFEMRALPATTDKASLHAYKVTKSINVETATIARHLTKLDLELSISFLNLLVNWLKVAIWRELINECNWAEKKLDILGVNVNTYSLCDEIGNEQYCLTNEGQRWQCFYSERGQKTGEKTFDNEGEACLYFYTILEADPTVRVKWSS